MGIATEAGMPRILDEAADAKASSGLITLTLAVACILHLILILGVSFRFPHSSTGKDAARQLEILVLRQAAPSDKKPEIADAYATQR